MRTRGILGLLGAVTLVALLLAPSSPTLVAPHGGMGSAGVAVPPSPEPGVVGTRSLIAGSTPAPAPAQTAPSASPTPSTSGIVAGTVSETLDLRNGTLLPGNVQLPGNGFGPYAVAVDPAADRTFVSNSYSSEVTVLESGNETVVGTIPESDTPIALGIDPAHGEVFVLGRPTLFFGSSGTLTWASESTGSVLASVAGLGVPAAMALDPANGLLYVAIPTSNSLTVVNESTHAVNGSVAAGTNPQALAYDAGNHTLYVADNVSAGQLTLIDTTNNTVTGTIPVGANPDALLILPGTTDLFVANLGGDSLTVVDDVTNTVIATIPLGAGPMALGADPANGFVYADNASTNSLDVVNSHVLSVSATVTVGDSPAGIAYDSGKSQILVAETGSDNVTLVDPANQLSVGSITFGLTPGALAYDPHDDVLAVAMADRDALWLLNGTTEQRIAAITVGVDPVAVTYDSINYCFYVANFVSNTVTIVNGSTERRLGTVSVGQQPVGIAFSPVYDYLFVENSGPSNIGQFYLTEINGITNAVVGTLTLGTQGYLNGIAYDATNGDLYIGVANNVTVLNPLSKLIVATLNLTQDFDTILVVPTTGEVVVGGAYTTGFGASYNLSVINASTNTVNETVRVANGVTGLDYDPQNGALYVSSEYSDTVGVVDLARGVETANLTVGWYPGAIADDGHAGHVFVAAPFNASVAIAALPGLGAYPVNFTEQGLPSGHSWTVTVTGKTFTSTTASILLVAPVGVSPFQVTAVPGYSAKPASGNLTVTDSFLAQTIVFTRLPPTYPVQLAEAGLPSGTNWSVTFNGTLRNSTFATITFQSPNGTFEFTVTPVAGYTELPGSGTVVVSGVPVLENITFRSVTVGTSSHASGFAFGEVEGYLVAAVGAAVGGAVGVVVGRRGGGRTFPAESEPPDPSA